MEKVTQEKRRMGRPPGSGAQLPSKERLRLSRENLAKSGGTRLDFSLDAVSSTQLTELMEHWDMKTRKKAVQHALSLIYQTIKGKK